MNQWLAQIYGTGGISEDDLEKTAQNELLAQLAAEEGIDLSGLNPDQLNELAAELLGDQGQGFDQGFGAQPGFAPQQGFQAQVPQGFQGQGLFAPAFNPALAQQGQGQQGYDEMAVKEAQAKWEEADLLGRVMAHAYTQEVEKIAMEKQAGTYPRAGFGRRMDQARHHLGRAGQAVSRAAHSSVSGLRRGARRLGSLLAGGDRLSTGGNPSSNAPRAGNSLASFALGGKNRSEFLKSQGARGAAALGAGAAGYGAKKALEKEASAFEKLAEMQAAEILSASGFDPSTGVDMTQQGFGGDQQFQQQGGGQEEFQSALDNRALEMLAEAGYDVNEILARLQGIQGQG